MPLLFKTDNRTTHALSHIGRTEDIHISPDGRYLALAAYLTNKILMMRINANQKKGKWSIELKESFEITSPSLNQPHGIFWIDNEHIIVANRSTDTAIFELPKKHSKLSLNLEPISSIKIDKIDLLNYSSCLHIYNLGLGLYEALICSNEGHYVSSHILDGNRNFLSLSSIILLKDDLNVPDGIVVSNDKKWIAVSNHDKHNVYVYLNQKILNQHTLPSAILNGPLYPHGIIFHNDDHYIFVADASAPYVYGFFSSSGDWKGQLKPFIKLKVMEDAFYKAGHINSQEGGPKGIYISQNTNLLIITCDQVRVAFFDLKKILKPFNHKFKIKALDKKESLNSIKVDPIIRHLNYLRLNVSNFNDAIERLVFEKNKNDSLTVKLILKFIFNKLMFKIKRFFKK
jgi:hypothetical protein